MNSTIIKAKPQTAETRLPAVTPLILLPLLAYALFIDSPAWQLMWMLGLSVYAGMKWLTYDSCPAAATCINGPNTRLPAPWPGMNAKAFFNSNLQVAKPPLGEWLQAFIKLAFGFAPLLRRTSADRTASVARRLGWHDRPGVPLELRIFPSSLTGLPRRRRCRRTDHESPHPRFLPQRLRTAAGT